MLIAADVPIVANTKKAVCTLLEKAQPLSVSEWIDEINRWKTEYPIVCPADRGKFGLTSQMVIEAVLDNVVTSYY